MNIKNLCLLLLLLSPLTISGRPKEDSVEDKINKEIYTLEKLQIAFYAMRQLPDTYVSLLPHDLYNDQMHSISKQLVELQKEKKAIQKMHELFMMGPFDLKIKMSQV